MSIINGLRRENDSHKKAQKSTKKGIRINDLRQVWEVGCEGAGSWALTPGENPGAKYG